MKKWFPKGTLCPCCYWCPGYKQIMKENDPVVILMDTFPDLMSVQLRAFTQRSCMLACGFWPFSRPVIVAGYYCTAEQWWWPAAPVSSLGHLESQHALHCVAASVHAVGHVLSMHFQLTILSVWSLHGPSDPITEPMGHVYVIDSCRPGIHLGELVCNSGLCLFPHQWAARFSLHSCLL